MKKKSKKTNAKTPKKLELVTVEFGEQKIVIPPDLANVARLLMELEIDIFGGARSDVPKGYTCMEFQTAQDLEGFLNIVSEFSPEPEDMYERSLQEMHTSNLKDKWEYKVVPFNHASFDAFCAFDDGEISEDEYMKRLYTEPPHIYVSILVYFPKKDIQEIEGRLAEFVEMVREEKSQINAKKLAQLN